MIETIPTGLYAEAPSLPGQQKHGYPVYTQGSPNTRMTTESIPESQTGLNDHLLQADFPPLVVPIAAQLIRPRKRSLTL